MPRSRNSCSAATSRSLRLCSAIVVDVAVRRGLGLGLLGLVLVWKQPGPVQHPATVLAQRDDLRVAQRDVGLMRDGHLARRAPALADGHEPNPTDALAHSLVATQQRLFDLLGQSLTVAAGLLVAARQLGLELVESHALGRDAGSQLTEA